MRPQSDAQVAAALAELEAIDEQLASDADAALNSLTWDEGLESISQHGLQRFLWYVLPRKWRVGADEQRAIADALGQLFAKVGLPRYAAICRDEDTTEVVAAYARGDSAGFKAFGRAEQRSGVAPPDLPDHANGFAWSSVMGLEEGRAFHATAAALELSILAGDLAPGSRGWRTRQRELAHAYLNTARPELGGASWLALIGDERRAMWRRSRGQPRQRLIATVEPLLDDSMPAPIAAGDAVEPLRWLLDEAEHGLPLTQTNRLARDVVLRAAQRFGWYDPKFPPRTETDVIELHEVHALARNLRLVRRRGRLLLLTTRGRELRTDPEALWKAVALQLAEGATFDAAVAEMALAMLLLDEACEIDRLVESIVGVLAAEGWHDEATGEAPDPDAVRRALWTMVRPAEALGLMAMFGGWRERSLGLTRPGRGAALLALRRRATGPVHRLS